VLSVAYGRPEKDAAPEPLPEWVRPVGLFVMALGVLVVVILAYVEATSRLDEFELRAGPNAYKPATEQRAPIKPISTTADALEYKVDQICTRVAGNTRPVSGPAGAAFVGTLNQTAAYTQCILLQYPDRLCEPSRRERAVHVVSNYLDQLGTSDQPEEEPATLTEMLLAPGRSRAILGQIAILARLGLLERSDFGTLSQGPIQVELAEILETTSVIEPRCS
jgi:hypothetical protein